MFSKKIFLSLACAVFAAFLFAGCSPRLPKTHKLLEKIQGTEDQKKLDKIFVALNEKYNVEEVGNDYGYIDYSLSGEA